MPRQAELYQEKARVGAPRLVLSDAEGRVVGRLV